MNQENINQCPVCHSQLNDLPKCREDGHYINCPRCGKFFIDGSLEACLDGHLQDDLEKIAILSYYIRRLAKNKEFPELHPRHMKEILKNRLPSVREQVNNMIIHFAEETKGPGEQQQIKSETHMSIAGSKTMDGFAMIIRYLENNGLIEGIEANSMNNRGSGFYTLSVDGWDYYEEILKEGHGSKKAFMAMKFGNPTLDDILDNALRPAVRDTGFELQKLDDTPKAGLIDDRMRVEIRTSRFILADLTHDNPGAYWEAGYAEGLGKPVIYTCEKNKFNRKKTHFDTNHHLTVIWDSKDIQGTISNLKATIRATLPGEAKLED